MLFNIWCYIYILYLLVCGVIVIGIINRYHTLSLNTVNSTNCNVQCNSTKTTELCGSSIYGGSSSDVYAYVYQITNSSNYITTSLLIQILLFSNWFIIFLFNLSFI